MDLLDPFSDALSENQLECFSTQLLWLLWFSLG